jgi:hypothetical protein
MSLKSSSTAQEPLRGAVVLTYGSKVDSLRRTDGGSIAFFSKERKFVAGVEISDEAVTDILGGADWRVYWKSGKSLGFELSGFGYHAGEDGDVEIDYTPEDAKEGGYGGNPTEDFLSTIQKDTDTAVECDQHFSDLPIKPFICVVREKISTIDWPPNYYAFDEEGLLVSSKTHSVTWLFGHEYVISRDAEYVSAGPAVDKMLGLT